MQFYYQRLGIPLWKVIVVLLFVGSIFYLGTIFLLPTGIAHE